MVIGETSIVGTIDSTTVRSRGNTVTDVHFTVASLPAPVTMVVDQVATALTVAVAFGQAVLTLTGGATLPLACQVFHSNRFLSGRELGSLDPATNRRADHGRMVHGEGAGYGAGTSSPPITCSAPSW